MANHEMTVAALNVTCLRVTSHSGRVELFAEERSDILVLGDRTSSESADGTVTLSSSHGSSTLGVRFPAGLNVVVGTASGKITVSGEVGDIRATSASGSIEVESARSADLRSQSGNVSIGRCESACRIQTASGSVQVGTVAAAAEVATQSGKVNVKHAGGKARVRTASGRVDVGATGESDIAIDTMSGGVIVRLPAGTRPTANLYGVTGRTHCELASGTDCRVAVRSMNGKIDVVSA